MNVSQKALRLGLVGPMPPPNGGMAMQTLQLARLLFAAGIDVEMLATNSPCRPALLAGIPAVRALFRLIPFLFAVWRMAGRVDVIHLMANSGWSWQLCSAPVLWLAWLRSTPVVVNYRGGEARDYFRRSFRRVRPSLRKAAAIVVPSGYLEGVFREFGEATRVIPNIIDSSVFRPQPGSTPEAPPALFTLAITRNLEAIYGIDTAIDGFARAFTRDGSLRLLIAGSGPQEDALRSLARQLGVGEVVTFTGRLDRAGILALYAGADAVINPSTVDNMPNSVLEALACGLPVISTDVGGVPHIVRHGETALLVPSGDAGALAAAILQLRGDGALRAHLSSNGLAHVEKFDWGNVRHQWLDLYAHLGRRSQAVAV